MKFNPSRCPECGGEVAGTLEVLTGVALVVREEEDDPEQYSYDGNSEIFWDTSNTQMANDWFGGTDYPEDAIAVQCEEGHEFGAVLTTEGHER